MILKKSPGGRRILIGNQTMYTLNISEKQILEPEVISIKYEYSVAISTEAITLRYKINTTATSL